MEAEAEVGVMSRPLLSRAHPSATSTPVGQDSDVVALAIAEGRRRCGNVLPEGFTITTYKNGRAWGRWWGGDCRGPREWVEDWLFLCTLNGQETCGD